MVYPSSKTGSREDTTVWRRLLLVVSEVILVFISAILGAFAWNHLSPIFNSMDWWRKLMEDIAKYWQAYLAIGVLLFLLFLVLYFRARIEANTESDRVLTILEAIARKLGVNVEEIGNDKSKRGDSGGDEPATKNE